MIIDIAIIIFVISALLRGKEICFIRQLCSTIGIFVGLFIGALLEPSTIKWFHTAASRSLDTIGTTIGCALIVLTVGEYTGMSLKHKVLLKKLNSIDNLLGG